MSPPRPDRLPRLVFTVTTGRSGTEYLQRVLDCLPGVLSVHEPEPDFAEAMRPALADPSVATRFLLERKLPFIRTQECDVYAESSHLFCKGFLEPLLRLQVVPDLIFLSRPHREVATSLLRLKTIPGRTPLGRKYLLQPDDPGVLPLPGWQSLHDYQLCYWYALAIEDRSGRYRALAESAGARISSIMLAELTTRAGFDRLTGDLRLPSLGPIGLARYLAVRGRSYNTKSSAPRAEMAPEELARLESEVASRVPS